MQKFSKMLVLAIVLVAAAGIVPLQTAQSQQPQATSQLSATEGDQSVAGIRWECHVDSRVNSTIRVYINGIYRGTLAPFGDIFPIVGDFPNEVTTLYAVSNDGRTWSQNVYGNIGTFHWTLY